MRRATRSRRSLLGLAGAAVTGGCLSGPDGGPSPALPILVALTVANDTDREREYRVRVAFAADGDATPETVSEFRGTVGARDRRELDDDWPKEAGRYRVEITVDGGDWHTEDLTDRLRQEERICYRQELAIGESDVTFPIDPNAPCPD